MLLTNSIILDTSEERNLAEFVDIGWGENPGIAYRKSGIRDRIKHIVIPGIDHLLSV
jgi:hypothetical protein